MWVGISIFKTFSATQTGSIHVKQITDLFQVKFGHDFYYTIQNFSLYHCCDTLTKLISKNFIVFKSLQRTIQYIFADKRYGKEMSLSNATSGATIMKFFPSDAQKINTLGCSLISLDLEILFSQSVILCHLLKLALSSDP